MNHSILPEAYHGYGAGNLDADPRFVRPAVQASLSAGSARFSAGFDGFEASRLLQLNGGAPHMRLQPESPAIRAGVNGADMGYDVSPKRDAHGLPETSTSATERHRDSRWHRYRRLQIRLVRTRQRHQQLERERESQQPIQLSGLASPGTYTLEVIRKNSLGIWQDASQPTRGHGSSMQMPPRVCGSARNPGAQCWRRTRSVGRFCGCVELFNESAEPIDLTGCGSPIRRQIRAVHFLPPGTILGGGGYLVVWSGMPSPASACDWASVESRGRRHLSVGQTSERGAAAGFLDLRPQLPTTRLGGLPEQDGR